jgi:multiple sugar transport system substrate-binding protein
MYTRTVSRRKFLMVGSVLAGMGVLGACAGTPQVVQQTVEVEKVVKETVVVEKQVTAPPAAKEPVLIRHGWWIPGDWEWAKVMDRVAKRFMELNPDIKVQVESSGWADYWQRVQVQIAGGEGMDVMWMSGAYFVNLWEKGAILELTPYVQRDNFDYELYIKQEEFFPEGKVWTMPYTGWGGQLITFNMNAFDEAGIPYPTNDWTWDDWRDAAVKLTKREGDKVVQWGQWIQTGAEYGWLRYLRCNGGNWINQEKTKTTLDDPKCIEAIQWIYDQMFTYKCAPNATEQGAIQQAGVIDPFYSGMVAMAGEQELRLDLLRTEGLPPDGKVKPQVVLMPPSRKGGKRWYNGNTNPTTIWSGSKHKEEAWKWILHLAGREAMQALMETAGYPLTSVYKPLNEDDKVGFLKPIPGVEWLNLRTIVEALNYWTGLDFHRKWMDWVNAMQAEMDYAWLGERTAEEACKAATIAGDQVLQAG